MRSKEDIKFAIKFLVALFIIICIFGFFIWGTDFFDAILKLLKIR